MSIIDGTLPIDTSEWPRNLVDAVLGRTDETELDGPDAVQYIGDEGTLAVAMALARLTQRERNVLQHRFVEHESLHETGKHFGVTQERIRQIEAKALRKLRRPVCQDVLKKGVYQWMMEAAHEMAEQIAEERARAMFVDWQRQYLDDWKAMTDNSRMVEEAVAEQEDGINSKTIEELDLSVRSFNCLKRKGLNTVGQIREAAKDPVWYRKVRNLGRKSYEEICRKMWDLGINIETEAEA